MRDLQEDLEVYQTATPGRWIYQGNKVVAPGGTVLSAVPSFNTETGEWDAFLDFKDDDMAFILTAHEALPYWLERVKKLQAEVNEHRERANDYQTRWEAHRAQDCAMQCSREIAETLGTYDPVEAARIVRELKAKAAAMRKAIEATIPEIIIYANQAQDGAICLWKKRRISILESVIAGDTGRDLLERLQKLEAVIEKVKTMISRVYCPYGCTRTFAVEEEDLDALKQALAALEGGDRR